jgi:hypothetical protein
MELPTTAPELMWSTGEDVCALSDSERHLGHAFREGRRWIAFDALHSNADGDDFLPLGRFETAAHAKLAIEKSAGVKVIT